MRELDGTKPLLGDRLLVAEYRGEQRWKKQSFLSTHGIIRRGDEVSVSVGRLRNITIFAPGKAAKEGVSYEDAQSAKLCLFPDSRADQP
jgi:hypothetical protein